MSIGVYGATAIDGGSLGALDEIDGAGLGDGDIGFVVNGDEFYVYKLDVDSGLAEDSPDVIKPDTNAGNKRWIRKNMFASIVSEPSSGEHRVKSIKQLASGDWEVIYETTPEP